jgi:hypothetical protein
VSPTWWIVESSGVRATIHHLEKRRSVERRPEIIG